MTGQKSSTIAIVTVHGTGDTASGADGTKWYQRGSSFSERLKQRLAQDGVEAEIVPHLWSGANSAWDRERGANGLARMIRRLYDRYDTIHVIGHSHGGNVANDAAVLLKWGLRKNAKKERFDTLITVGTPFLNARTGWVQMTAGLIFMALTWGSALAFVITVLGMLGAAIFVSGQTLQPGQEAVPLWPAFLYLLLVGPCVWLMFRMSTQGVRRILRPRTGGKTRTSVFSIWHQNDEAIAFLQRVEELPLEAFPRGAMFRGSRGGAISFGVLAVIIIAVAVPVLFMFGIDLLHIGSLIRAPVSPIGEAQTPENEAGYFASLVGAVIVLGFWIAPPLFTLVYLLFRYIIGGASEIGVRGSMNRYVRGILRGIAMGRDGDQILCNVGPRSHTHATQEYVLTGECATRMQEGANGAAGKLIDKYRWALFSVGGDSSASLTSLTTDAMTWDSLIHTTYFDQPEVAIVIGDYIAASVKGELAHVLQAGPSVEPVAPAPQPAPVPVAHEPLPGPGTSEPGLAQPI